MLDVIFSLSFVKSGVGSDYGTPLIEFCQVKCENASKHFRFQIPEFSGMSGLLKKGDSSGRRRIMKKNVRGGFDQVCRMEYKTRI